MHTKTLAMTAVLALLAACDKPADPRSSTNAPPSRTESSATAGPSQPSATTPSTPANLGQPASQAEKREGANPVQQQVDPKEREQHRDFQQRGDSKGPTGPDTQPRPGSGR